MANRCSDTLALHRPKRLPGSTSPNVRYTPEWVLAKSRTSHPQVISCVGCGLNVRQLPPELLSQTRHGHPAKGTPNPCVWASRNAERRFRCCAEIRVL